MSPPRLLHERLTWSIIGGFREVYDNLGEGFVESIYSRALERELVRRGHRITRELAVQVYYKGDPLGWQRLDMVVEDVVVVEIKSTAVLPPNARRQLLNYLRATRLEVGLLLHFGSRPRHYREFSSNERLAPPALSGPSVRS